MKAITKRPLPYGLSPHAFSRLKVSNEEMDLLSIIEDYVVRTPPDAEEIRVEKSSADEKVKSNVRIYSTSLKTKEQMKHSYGQTALKER